MIGAQGFALYFVPKRKEKNCIIANRGIRSHFLKFDWIHWLKTFLPKLRFSLYSLSLVSDGSFYPYPITDQSLLSPFPQKTKKPCSVTTKSGSCLPQGCLYISCTGVKSSFGYAFLNYLTKSLKHSTPSLNISVSGAIVLVQKSEIISKINFCHANSTVEWV